MRTELRIEAEADVGPAIHATGGLAARRTAADTVHVVGAAATPLGGDHLDIVVTVGAGARLVLRSVAATLALPGLATRLSTARWVFRLAEGARLDFAPEPTIIAADAVHHSLTELHVAGSAQLRVCERIQIGRAGEDSGRWKGELHADLGGLPWLRHTLELGPGCATDDPLAAPRALISELTYPDPRPAATAHDSVLLPLAAGGTLHSTWRARL